MTSRPLVVCSHLRWDWAFQRPQHIVQREAELFGIADVVFTGGPSLFKAKRARHPNVHCFPSSVDEVHFAGARSVPADPADQANIPLPRLGYFGVIDEHMDDLRTESFA